MKTAAEYRAIAREQLTGNWTNGVILSLVYMVVVLAFNSISYVKPNSETLGLVLSFLTLVVSIPMAYGLTISFLDLGRGQELKVGNLFAHYNKRVLTTMLLAAVYTYLWALLLIVPGIIKGYSYAMTPYVLADNPELSNNAAIEKSMEMMQGNKMKLFLLDLSFIGWILLSFLTLCIGFFWVAPYMYQARAAFYEDLKAEQAC